MINLFLSNSIHFVVKHVLKKYPVQIAKIMKSTITKKCPVQPTLSILADAYMMHAYSACILFLVAIKDRKKTFRQKKEFQFSLAPI